MPAARGGTSEEQRPVSHRSSDVPALVARIRARLDLIQDPCSVAAGAPMGLDEMGLVREIRVSPGGDVTIDLRLTSPFCHLIGFFQAEATRLAGELDDVRSVTVKGDMGLDWSPDLIAPQAQARRRLPS